MSDTDLLGVLLTRYAVTPEDRRRGLMHCEHLPHGKSMTFVFDEADRHRFWNANVPFPIDIAFCDAQGHVVDIGRLAANQTESVGPSVPCKFAVEANAGAFDDIGVRPGRARLVTVQGFGAVAFYRAAGVRP